MKSIAKRRSPQKQQDRPITSVVNRRSSESRRTYLSLTFLLCGSAGICVWFAWVTSSPAVAYNSLLFAETSHADSDSNDDDNVVPTSSSSSFLRGVSASKVVLRSDLSNRDPLKVWEAITQIDPAKINRTNPLVAIEVGVHTPTQCIQAATLGFNTHCFEPSPTSYARVEKGLAKVPPDVRKRLFPHQAAVGSTSGQTIPFHATGGTGDHVGEYDMWKMKKRDPVPENDQESGKSGSFINVPTVRLDDYIKEDVPGGKVHLLKVDTQGFEPSVFAGLQQSIAKASIKYIIFEFWPRGMDLHAGTKDECVGHQVLDQLVDAGYELYGLGVEAHPKAPMSAAGKTRHEGSTRPWDKGTLAYCKWFFEVEGRYPVKEGAEEYLFGYWADFLAVAPGEKLPDEVFQKK